MKETFVPETDKLNPGLAAIFERFKARYDRVFDAADRPIAEFFEDVGCYNCGARWIQSEFVIARFRHVRCAWCGMIYVTPRLNEGLVQALYNEDDYTEHYKLKLIPALPYRTSVINPRKHAQLMQHFRQPGSILDVGCGLGDFLFECKKNGWRCRGIEFNRFASEYAAREFGVEVIAKSICDFDETVGMYDCISLWGVLEHFTQPLAALEKLRTLLKPTGVLLLEVPSSDSFLVRYFERYGGYVDRIIEGDRHHMLFSVRALREMTGRAGFREIRLLANGLDFDTLARVGAVSLDKDAIARLQPVLDESLAGDLLRGYFTLLGGGA